MILCVGLATVDLVYRVDRVPGVDEKAQATDMSIAAGGPAANAAVAAAALGAPVTLLTAIGAHPLGDLVRADLTAHGVHILDAAASSPHPPPVSAVTVLNGTGQRTIVSRNAGDQIVPVPPEGVPDAAVTLVDGHHPALAVAAARAARRLVVDAGTWRPVFTDIFPHAEVVACSAAFQHPATRKAPATTPHTGPPTSATPHTGPPTSATPHTGTQRGATPHAAWPTSATPHTAFPDRMARDAATAGAVGAPHVLVTHGPDPVHWFSGDSAGSVPVTPVEAVDTAGAGDVFHGALAAALAGYRSPHTPHQPIPHDKSDLSEAIAVAVRVAGVRVAHPGPRSWLTAL